VLGPVGRRIEAELLAGAQVLQRVQRQVDVGVGRGIRPEEPGRRDTDDREREVVDQDRRAGGTRRAPEAALGEGVAHDRDRGRTGLVVAVPNQPSGRGADAEPAEVPARHVPAARQVGFSADRDVHAPGLPVPEVREHAREDSLLRAEEFEDREREDTGRRTRRRVAPRAAAHRAHDGDSLALRVPVQNDEGLGIRDGERAQQDGVHEAVDRRVGPDAEPERQDDQHREQPVGGHRPQRVAHVLAELLQDRPSPGGAGVFAHEREVAQRTPCRPPRLVVGQALGAALVRFLIEVELQLLAQLGFLVAPADEPAQLPQERSHRPSSCAAGFRIRPMARLNASHFECSAAS